MTVQSLAKTQTRGEIIETILVKGDLAKLTADERNSYYLRVCESVGLNPLTRPLEYITLSGRLVLYARKDATDQLRSIHNVSVTDLTESERDGVYIVTAKVLNGEGRTDMAKGAVNIANLKGEHLANAIMKTETKAKRRATLSICGLGFLDETEIEDSAGSVSPPPPPAKSNVPSPPKSRVPSPPAPLPAPHSFKAATTADWAGRMLDYIAAAKTTDEVVQWDEMNRDNLKVLAKKDPARLKTVMAAMKARREELTPAEIVTVDGEIVPAQNDAMPSPVKDPEEARKWVVAKLMMFKEYDKAEAFWNGTVAPTESDWFPPDWEDLLGVWRKLEQRLAP
jgi:hypothetical protein